MDNPGVIGPPPLIVGAFTLASLALDRSINGVPSGRQAKMQVAGMVLAGGAAALAGWAALTMRAAGTSIDPHRPATALVCCGPFRLTRNPLYLSLLAFQAALGLILASPRSLLGLLPAAAVLRYGVIAREERYLARKFGDAYRDYRRSVARWL